MQKANDVCLESPSAQPDRQRFRLRFRKHGDLRWISHRDLVRTVERMVRRAGLVLRMSEGFHPKPKMMFPSALALGIEGQAEVMELELVRPVDPLRYRDAAQAQAPPGLVISQVQVLDPGQGKAQFRAMTYQFPVSQQRRQQVEQAIEQLLAGSTLWVGATTGLNRSTCVLISSPWNGAMAWCAFASVPPSKRRCDRAMCCRPWDWPSSNNKAIS